jgi:hypothetical protein
MERGHIIVNNIKLQLEEDGSFVVKEFVALDICVALVFYIIFFVALHNISHERITSITPYLPLLVFLLGCAAAYTFKAFSKRKYIQVNSKGIWINSFFVTDWDNFVSARYKELKFATRNSYVYKYVLFLYYYKSNGVGYVRKVPIISTQNRAEEEVIAAIKYFYQQHAGA